MLSVCEWLLIVEVDLLHPHKKWVVSLWGFGGMSLTSLCGVVQAVLYFWWASGRPSKFLGECASLRLLLYLRILLSQTPKFINTNSELA